MKRLKKVISVLLGIMIIGSLVGCEKSKSTSKEVNGEKSNKQLNVVNIGGTTQGQILNSIAGVAQKLGYFEEELNKVGYTGKINGFQSGPAINEALASKSLDVGFVGDLPGIIAKNNGLDLKIFAITGKQTHYALIAQVDSKSASVKDMEGKTVCVPTGTVLQYYYQQLIKANNVDVSKVKTINDANTAFVAKNGDFLVYPLYGADSFVKKGLGKIIETTLDHPEWTSQGVSVGRREFLDKNPKAAEAIIKALKRAREYAASNPSEYYNILSSATGGSIGVESFKVAYGYDETFKNDDPIITQESIDKLKSIVDFAYENKLIKKKFDVNTWIDSSYYKNTTK